MLWVSEHKCLHPKTNICAVKSFGPCHVLPTLGDYANILPTHSVTKCEIWITLRRDKFLSVTLDWKEGCLCVCVCVWVCACLRVCACAHAHAVGTRRSIIPTDKRIVFFSSLKWARLICTAWSHAEVKCVSVCVCGIVREREWQGFCVRGSTIGLGVWKKKKTRENASTLFGQKYCDTLLNRFINQSDIESGSLVGDSSSNQYLLEWHNWMHFV